MVLENVTIFELHFDGARFGPSFGRDDDTDESKETPSTLESADTTEREHRTDIRTEDADDESSRPGLRRLFLAGFALSAIASVVATVLARRLRDDTDTFEPSDDYETTDETVEIETTSADADDHPDIETESDSSD